MDAGGYLCAAAELPEGASKGFGPRGGRPGFFLLRFEGRAHAYRDACPHYGDTPLAWRGDAYLNGDGSRIVCAAHGAQFDIASGACTLGPCLGQSLARIDLVITTEQQIYMRREGERDTQHDIDS
jgi:nitrite reductase/ring-hydroxylating ferredoxin subunit